MTLDPTGHQIFLVTAKFGPPATAGQPHPRPAILPQRFVVLVVGGQENVTLQAAR